MHMKQIRLAATALLAVIAVISFLATLTGSAAGADLGRGPYGRAPAYAPAPLYNWSGFYLGLNAGGAWGTSSWDSAAAPTGDFDVSGGMIGATLGYNWQFGQWVVGVESDIDWTNIRGSTTVNCPLGCTTSNNWFGTIRGRVGYSWDRFLPYFTAGGAFGDIEASTPHGPGSSSTEVGWVIGAGVEFALTREWTAKIEYLYADLGSFDCGTRCGSAPPDNINFNTSILRGGVNFRF
jgi:outer membrane immunogenic protein